MALFAKAFSCLALANLIGQAATTMVPVVDVHGLGSLEGETTDKNVVVFRGIPYARPPLGQLRWKSPVPHGPWHPKASPRKAVSYGHACIPMFKSPNVTTSEDCLFLNVATPAQGLLRRAKLPVMVYIHGGAYCSGASNNNKPEVLVAQSAGSVVVVTMNYRLNIFGFLGSSALQHRSAHRGTGNYGIEDQRMALRWVRSHIKAFGGDKHDVTIFGESAGGNSVLNHLTQAASFGLYSRAIIESGTYVGAVPLAEAHTTFQQVLNHTGCDDVDCLENVSAQSLMDTVLKLPETIWAPSIDQVSLRGLPQELISSGTYNNKVAVLLGSNRDEASFFLTPPAFPANFTEDNFDTELSSFKWRNNLTDIKYHYDPSRYAYPAARGNFSRWWWEFMRVVTEGGFNNRTGQPAMGLGHCSVRCMARALLRGGTPRVFTYLFSRPSQEVLDDLNEGVSIFATGPGSVVVPHASEVPYVFGRSDMLGVSNGEVSLSQNMSAYWQNFAKHGNPNGAGLPYWPSYHAHADDTMVLDVGEGNVRSTPRYHAEQCDFFDQQPFSVCSATASQDVYV